MRDENGQLRMMEFIKRLPAFNIGSQLHITKKYQD